MKNLIYLGQKTKTGKLLLDEFSKKGYNIIYPSLNDISYFKDGSKTTITHKGVDISFVDVVLIRSTKIYDIAKMYTLVLSLEKNGAYVIDGSDRVKRSSAYDKSTSSLLRASNGIPTFIPSNVNIQIPFDYPVIVKPIDGKYCKGVSVCNDISEYRSSYYGNNGNVIVQKYFEFQYENRVLILKMPHLPPKIIYIASKKNVARKGTKRKASFVPSFVRKSLEEYVENTFQFYSHKAQGLIGYDIGTLNGKHYVIEANMSPRFDRATDKLGINIAKIIVDHIDGFALSSSSIAK